ncbi:MAG: GDSL-type esterase/lipase family protein, partial [Pirellulales bacterium]
KVSWILKQDGEETVVAVDRFRFTFDAGRVTGDRDLVLRFKAVYEDGVKTIDIPVSVQEAIFEPAFTLQAPSNWNGRQSIEIISDVTNLKQMQAQGADKLDYDWRVSGLATINRSELGKLVLKRAQNSGTVTITATISNGGAGVSASTTIEVKEPNYDAWVQRVPDKDEKPQDNQFYARDDTNLGTAYCNGTLTQTADALLLKLYSDDKLIKTLTQKPTQGDAYSFAVKLKPGLIKYRIELVAETDEKETILHQATNLVCGDAYIIEGQSNALATDTREQSPLETNEWIRSFATVRAAENDPTNLWCNPVWKSGREHKAQLGWWGMELAKRLVRSQKIPICIINGAAGGTRIDQHQRSESNPTDPETIYGRLLWRVQEAKLTHGIRAVLWHQGESDQGAAGPDGGYGWETYQQYFVRMSAAWKQDFPNIRHYYVYQIWPNACSMGNGNGDMLRERQRTLPSLFSNMAILSTLGIQPGGGCHYPLEGWTKFAEMVQPLIERDLYARDALRFLTPPNLKRASYTNSAKDAIALEFDQAVAWDDKLVGQFYLDNEEGAVASGSVSGSVVTLKLKGKMATGKITYLKEMQWSQDKLLLGKNGLAALTFCQVPIEEPVEVTTDPDFYTTDTLASRPVPRPFSHMWSLWMKRHNDLADGLAQQKKVDLLVVGDSIAFRFERGGHNIWKKYYEKRNGYNFASSGDRTEHILWRLQNGKLDTIQPKLAMLLIGTNNTSRAEETPEETAYAIEAITKELKKRLPSAKILLLGIFPRGAQVDDRNRLRNDQVNAIISKLDDGKKIFYLDVGNKFLNPDNSLNKQLINDTVHPVEKGFEVWAEAMESTIVKLMGE